MTNFYGQYVGFGAGTSGAAWTFQGEVTGYVSGGDYDDVIDKFSFASESTASHIGDMTVAKRGGDVGCNSSLHGYHNGGVSSGGQDTVIEQWAFASDGDSVDGGDCSAHGKNEAKGGHSSSTHGYSTGGYQTNDVIDKYLFASGTNNAVDTGNLVDGCYHGHSQSSSTTGYLGGGWTAGTLQSISRFEFASEGDATDSGDLTAARAGGFGCSSATNGYTGCGYTGGNISVIDKFAFASGTNNASNIGDMTAARRHMAGVSSTIRGFGCGGAGPVDTVDRFEFASDGDGTDVLNLSGGKEDCGGCQF